MNRPLCLTGVILGLALAVTAYAKPGVTDASPAAKQRAKVYIVQITGDPLAAYAGDMTGLSGTGAGKERTLDLKSADHQAYVDQLISRHDEVLGAVGGGRKIYDYNVAFNGFAAILTAEQADALRARGDVLKVWEDELLKPHTDSTPDFLGLTGGGKSPWSRGIVGEDVILGIIDSGIQPDHPSLADEPTHQKGNKGPEIPFGPAPASFTGSGCDFGNTAFNPLDAPFACNDKLLKAEAYSAGFQAFNPTFANGEFLSARDSDGHGTHTATTAGGNYGVEADIDGEPSGIVSGMAPRARVAVYKVCWEAPDPDDSGCFSSDSMAAIDQAVADGVDVINFSIGGPSTAFNGPDDIAFLFAADAGLYVAVSAGNAGPNPQTIGTPSGVPWVTSVAATEDDQNFGTGLQVNSPASIAGLYEGLEGAGDVSLADTGTITADVVPGAPLNGCGPLTNAADIDGNIALIIRGVCAFSDKYNNAAAAGASAIVVYNNAGDPIVMSAPGTTIPGIMIGFEDGDLINSTASSETVTGTLSPDIQVPRVDRIAGFSSRGPNGGAPDIIKPDVAAPGVNILAGETLFPNVNSDGGQFFQYLSGTSMSSPHVAGVFALLKQANPDWTPAIARSALMTSARQDLRKTFGDEAADPFDIGAGFIVPTDALDPSLAYDAGFLDYLAFLCGAENQPELVDVGTCAFLEAEGYSLDSSDLNLPSIGIADLVGSQTVRRTVTGVANNNGNKQYRVSIDAPPGIDVSVSPSSFRLRSGQTATYEVTFTVNEDAVFDEWSFGSLTWKGPGQNPARSPIAIRAAQLIAPDEVRGVGTDGSLSFDVEFGYTGPYGASMDGLEAGNAAPGTVDDEDANQHNFNVPAGTTLARFALYDDDMNDDFQDLDLQVFFFTGTGFVFVGSSGGPSTEEEVNIVNPTPGFYAVLVIDFATTPGPTDYTLFNYNLDGSDAGNTAITTPPSAVAGTTGTVEVDWFGLSPGTRHLGILNHDDGTSTIGQTEVLIDAQ